MIKKIFVIGSNVKKSLSPNIFKHWFFIKKVKAQYTHKQIKPELFEKDIKKILNDKYIVGFNVTIPYKEEVIKNLDKLEIHAKKIGAVNLVVKKDKKWIGKNTDWLGFKESIKHTKIKNKNKRAIVLGYGGASKAIIYALKKENFKKIYLYNRTKNKIKHLEKDKIINLIAMREVVDKINLVDIVINTTPIDVLKPYSKTMKKTNNVWAFDVVYNPKETAFLSHFNPKKRIYGISMLIFQAAPCYRQWFGEKINLSQKNLKLLEGLITK